MTDINVDSLHDSVERRLVQAVDQGLAEPAGARAQPVRRKRVAFALWFAALIGASAVIVLGAAPLVAP